jgi:EAL and modified HD-GYP domain-containing signal transduction protein
MHTEILQPAFASATSRFPLARLQAIANARDEWVALLLQLDAGVADDAAPTDGRDVHSAALQALLACDDALAALAPLDCIIVLTDAGVLTPALLSLLPVSRIIFCIPVTACAAQEMAWRRLAGAGYRILIDGAPELSPTWACGLSFDCAMPAPARSVLPGQHLARNVHSAARLLECRAAGFSWVCGQYPRFPDEHGSKTDGMARKRLLGLLGLLARDADSCELEKVIKQDPALSFHLLKLVNSASFAPGFSIDSFGHAINLMGRRQLQRWLQLLLYARGQDDAALHPLLPMAAQRGAQMEALCKIRGGDIGQQDLAFMVGVFSLLDVLLQMPMQEIVGALSLRIEVAMALQQRSGALGQMLALVENADVTEEALAGAGFGTELWWRSLLQACQYAIAIGRN